jgi:hypothetical protein
MRLHGTRLAAIAYGRGLGNALWDVAGAAPSLDQRFAENRSLVDAVSGQNLITFTRASDGTYVDSDGLIKTAGTDVPRFDHDPVTGECLGLLVEEQRTQLLELTDTLATQTKTVAAVAHTLSFYGTGTVALSGAHTATVVGTGAYPARTTLTFTPTAGSLTLTVTGTVQFGQLEAGAFATSYIPNAGTGQVTRSADVVSITGANFSSWYRQDEGSVYCEVSVNGADKGLWSIGDPTLAFGSRNSFYATNASGAGGQFVVSQGVNGVNQISSLACAGTFVPGVFLKTGFGFATNNAVGAGGGLVGVTDTLCDVPTGTFTLSLGSFASGWNTSSGFISGHIRRFVFWPQRLLNTTLQAITQ